MMGIMTLVPLATLTSYPGNVQSLVQTLQVKGMAVKRLASHHTCSRYLRLLAASSLRWPPYLRETLSTSSWAFSCERVEKIIFTFT